MNSNLLSERESRIQADKELFESLLRHGADLNKDYLIDFLFVV